MEERICAECSLPIVGKVNGWLCNRCKWRNQKKYPCSECGKPTGRRVTSVGHDPLAPVLCRACKSPLRHGTKRMYRQNRCRCDACREWKNADQRRYVAARLERDPDFKAKYRETEYAKAREEYSYTEALRQRDAARRALKAGATVEKFTHAEVFERDDWVCGICGAGVDRDATFPSPRSASLDHIIPLSLGGEHSRANTRCTHLRCNIKRGNRVAPQDSSKRKPPRDVGKAA